MYKTKKDVDKHVENLITKLSVKEFKTRAYSVARLYYEVGDYAGCQRYVEQYLTQKDNNAAAHKLLGQALQKLGQKEKALEHFKTSLDIDPTQTSTILDICELLADDEVTIDPGRAKYWCEKAEATFPRHPVTFRLRERLVTIVNPDPEAVVNLLKAELDARPKDAQLHARLIRHYLATNQMKEAFDHSCKVEFDKSCFTNNYTWYDTLAELLKYNFNNNTDWLYQLLLLTVKEHICLLSLTETPTGLSKSLVESNELLHAYDQAIESVAKTGAPPGFGEFHICLLQHHRGQFAFHAATFLLKKAKKDQLSWRDATKFAAPLMLIAWQTVPLDTKVNWLSRAPEKLQTAVHRWYMEGAYRCSQSGHYLLSNIQDKSQSFLDKVSQCCSGIHWRDKVYEKLFGSRDHLARIKTSHLVSNAFNSPTLRLPRRTEVEAYDNDAQRIYANSLHHFVWTLSNYKTLANFKCNIFDVLTSASTNCGPETLNKLDVHAFLYCATLTARQQILKQDTFVLSDKPNVLPANITDLLCSLPQMKWWDCAYKFSQNELGTELTDIRATLSRGIEVVRCMDNHGLDPELLCIIANIFNEQAKLTLAVDEKQNLEGRACLYYKSAIPVLEKLKSKIIVKMPLKRMFDYTHRELSMKELISLLEESKMYVAINYLNDWECEKAIELLSSLKSPQAYYHLSQTYKKIALEEINLSRENSSTESKSKHALLSKAKQFAYKALERLKDLEMNKNHPLYSDTQELIEEIEASINKIDPDLSSSLINENDGKYSSNENISTVNEHVPFRNTHHVRNLSSTPKHQSNANLTNYRTAVDSQMLETTRADHQLLERIENQIKNLQIKLTDDIMEQTKEWFEENRKLGNKIMNTIQSDIQNTNDQFKLLKISVDQVKDQIDECRNECKDVGDLKKQVLELKKEVSKLKKASSEQAIDENDLYNLDDDYRTSENPSAFTAQMPFQAPQVLPQFNQRLVPPFPLPPNPYQLYSQNLYNLYNQYSQFAQTPSIPGAPPLFDPNRAPVNYSSMYPTPDQMYLDMAHLVPPPVPVAVTASAVPTIPAVPQLSTAQSASAHVVSSTLTSVTVSKPTPASDAKEIPRSLPVNVVITSSDPLPTCTTTPAPIWSVTIPPKHIKATPHNYQIPMPSVSETKVISPPVFSFPSPVNKSNYVTTTTSLSNWPQSNVFKTAQTPTSGGATDALFYSSKPNVSTEKSVVDGVFTSSPNISINKSRTLSDRSNTSIENYDPCPDFKPIIPLPDEVKVTTGEEDEIVIFNSRAKLFRFVDKQWKERGIGEMKLLRHRLSGKVRVLMRREQIHKICANHIITPEMEITAMKNEAKAYFWVANDFADETVVLEKFCIRFKTADIAQEFYETFEKARLESKTSTPKKQDILIYTQPNKQVTSDSTFSSNQTKTEFGGFTFSKTPTFKPLSNDVKTESLPSEPATTKVNVFSGLTFKNTTTSPFSNIFTTTPANISTLPDNQKTPNNKLNTSDIVEDFESTAEFKPVVPLPALIDQKTGEEDEIVLFEHRAKLLRFDANSKEWKERGLGNMKLLVHKENIQKLRLLMRREQIMKVCCNHTVTKEMTFQKMTNMDKAVTWCAKDFSDGALVAETLCLRFKTVQACDNFMAALKTAQSKLKDESKAAKEEQNAAKQGSQVGFGDKFKPKPGSWCCQACYTNNLENFAKCACCEQPKPGTDLSASATNAPASSWGDKFKPKPDSWECNACLVRNQNTIDCCSACNNPRDPSMTKNETNLASVNLPKFSFGIPVTQKNESLSTTNIMSGWGDKFKPREGMWSCNQCFVRNESNLDKCSACASPKQTSASDKEAKSTFVTITSGPKFSFGIPLSNVDQKAKPEATSIFDGTGAHKFSFGIPVNMQANSLNVVTLEDQKSNFGTQKIPGNEGPVNLSSKKMEQENNTTPVKPALLPTPQIDPTTLGGKESGTFDFVFKPKTPVKGKSPVKSPKSQKGEDSDGNEYASEDEGHHLHFSPVIPLPDKVDVVTGEENETELYGHRAKLFRFNSGEWKERGVGIVKILKHKETNKLRVVMRREQVLKICLNHALTPEITYLPKDDKSWLFTANDFSEGKLMLNQFCLRFKSKEIALDFKEAVDKIRDNEIVFKKGTESDGKDSGSDDVIFVSEIQATSEEKLKAQALMLPENFYTYNNKEPCRGCRGCYDSDEQTKSTSAAPNLISLLKSTKSFSTPVSTPVKTSAPSFQSPSQSIYGTPVDLDKTDTSIFRTPLGSIAANKNSTLFSSLNSTLSGSDSTNKENTFTQPKNIFSGLGGQQSVFGSLQNKPANLFSTGDAANNSKMSVLATPKLNISGDEQVKVESVFNFKPNNNSLSTNSSLFANTTSGISSNTSIFNMPPSKQEENQKVEVKSIFGGDDQKPVNFFSNTAQGSLFGPGALIKDQRSGPGIFGSSDASAFDSSPQTQAFNSGASIFNAAANQAPTWSPTWTLGSAPHNTPDVMETKAANNDKIEHVKAADDSTQKDSPFKVDNSLSFAALSSGSTGFNIEKKNDFQWEGAGQQLFGAKASKGGDKSKDDSGAGDDGATAAADEEYDPHYEPIVPLPDKIIVTTGEEDEEKLFCERCKLFRYDDKTREWKERGVGELKILYHPERKTYRLLLRREQVHKAVLNMLLHVDLELLPMKNSDRAWTWPGRNYAENSAGEQETLAVRFKSVDLATTFKSKVDDCIRKLQAAAAQAINEKKEEKKFDSVAPLRLPKHLQDSARVDDVLSARVAEQIQSSSTQSQDTTEKQNGELRKQGVTEVFKQVHFQDPEEEQGDDDDDDENEEDYEHDYDQNEDYDSYYNEDDEEESATYFSCEGEAIVQQGAAHGTCDHAHIQVLFDQDTCSPKILVTDANTGEILADMLIHTDTEFQMSGDTCSWSGTDYTSNDPVDKTVTINFYDNDTAMQFYDSCETSKGATYSSTDPES